MLVVYLMNMSLDQVIGRAMELLDLLRADDELKRKAVSFATHVTGVDVNKPEIDEGKGIIREYIKIITDIGEIHIPMQLYVTDTTQIHETAAKLYELISKSMMPIIRDIYESIKKKSETVKDMNDEGFFLTISDVVGKALLITTDEKMMELASKVGENTSNIELVADVTDERTFDLVKLENVKNVDVISNVAIDLLDFINKMWNTILYPFIATMINA